MDEVPLAWAERHETLRYHRSEVEHRWQQRWSADGTHPHWLTGHAGSLPQGPRHQSPLHQGDVRRATVVDVARRYLASSDRPLPSPIELPRLGVVRLAGTRMSHRKGNVVGIQPILDEVGIDTLRLAHLQAKHPGQDLDWEALSLNGCARFLERVWRLARTDRGDIARLRHGSHTEDDDDIDRQIQRFIIATTDAYQRRAYNTAVAHFMALVNSLYPYALSDGGPHDEVLALGIDSLLVALAPATPHIAAELWSIRHDGAAIDAAPWPLADPARLTAESVTMIVQIDGKRRARLDVAPDLSATEAKALALADEVVQTRLAGASPTRVIVRSPNLVNIVTTR